MTYFISPGQIKKIKTMSGKLWGNPDAPEYYEMLRGQAGVSSSKELKGPKIQLVMKHLERCLGKDVGRASRPTQRGRRIAGEGACATPLAQNLPLRATDGEGGQLEYIRRLWGRVSRVAQEWGPESRQAHEALNKFLWRRFKVAAPEWLTLPQAQRVIEALKAMGRREQACGSG